jgi:acetyl-CoA carboxylase biotin carboxyl carrier protein
MPKTKATAGKTVDSNGKNVDKVIEIIQFMGDNHLAELELETSDLKIKLKKHVHSANVAIPVTQPIMAPISMPTMVNADTQVKPKLNKEAEKTAAVEDNFHKISSPMAGTFYRAPSPTSPPFVKEGDEVSVGQTICIVEAMKMMNEIKADKAGKIAKIMIENGQPVEKGIVLFHIGE